MRPTTLDARSFARLLVLIATLNFAGPFSAAAQQADAPNPKATTDNPAGVVLGGIGTGCIKVMSDGSIGQATINNNWFQPTGELPGCFGAVRVRSGSQVVSRIIALHSAYGLPVASAIDFDGAFPEAKLHCAEGSFPDADVTLRAFSPFVPGDVRNSAMPAAAIVFHVVNRSGSPITVTVALSWENTLGIGQTTMGDSFENRTGDTVIGIPDSEGFFGLRFAGPEHANKPSVGPAEDGASGDMTLMAHPYRNNAVVTTAGWNALDSKPGWWDSFAGAGLVSGTAPPGVQGKSHPAGVVAVQLVLKPRESIDVPMCISWYTPVLRSPIGDDYGHYYEAVFPDSVHVARAVLDDWQTLLALTEEWQRRITASSMPAELDHRIINSVSVLVTSSIFVRDGRFTLLPGYEANSAEQSDTYLSQRRYAADLLLSLFPQLGAQEMVNLLAVRMKYGKFPSSARDWAARIGPAATSEDPAEVNEGNPIDLPTAVPPQLRNIAGPPRIDADALADTSEYVIQADRLVASSDDLEFLRHAIQNIRSVVLTLLDHDVISTTAPPKGSAASRKTTDSILIGWLGALRSARRLAELAGEHAFEWAAPAGPLGSAPGGLIEVATEQHFVERCDSEIAKVEAEMHMRGILSPTALPAPSLQPLATVTDSDGLKLASEWDLLKQTEGYRINLQRGDLNLSTPIPGSWRSLSAPVFSATFVGRTEFKPTAHGGLLTLRIDRTITLSPIRSYRHRAGATGGPQLVIRTMRIAGPPPTRESGVPNTKPNEKPNHMLNEKPRAIDVQVSLGPNPIGCTVTREPSGTLLLAFASPLTLLTGDLLQVEVQ